MTTPNGPRVAVTDYMARFGGTNRREDWRVNSRPHLGQSLHSLVEAAQKSFRSDGSDPADSTMLVLQLMAGWCRWTETPEGCFPKNEERSAVVFSSSKGDLFRLDRDHANFLSGQEFSSSKIDLGWACDFAANKLGIGLRHESPVAACATGAHCIARGAQMIRWDQADWVLAGAVEASLTPLVMAGYRQLGALSKSGVMRPFDKRRDGFVPSEGIGALILENEETARTRGAKIYGYVTGWDMGADASSLTGLCPSGDSIARAIERALQRAGNPQIDYINAHGTATPLNDLAESRAIEKVFGRSVPVSSTKPLTGHLLGAAGAVEAVLCLQAMRESWAPPTLNLEEADDDYALDYIPVTDDECGRDLPMKNVLSLNYGFGGHIGVLVISAE